MAERPNISELWARAAAAHARGEARRAELSADRRPAAPGDVYLWVPANEYVAAGVVVGVDAGADLAYLVPADGNALAGLADVLVRDGQGEPLCLRCGRGQWVRRADLSPDRRYRVLSPHHVRRAQQKLQQISTAALEGPSSAWEAEADPDYADWIASVSAVVLAAAAQREPVAGGFFASRKHGGGFGLSELEAAFADTAAVAAFATALSDEAPGTAIPFNGPGTLHAVPEASGVEVVFEADATAAPPTLFAADAIGNWHALAWVVESDRAARATAPWTGAEVRLRAGNDPSAPVVVVARS